MTPIELGTVLSMSITAYSFGCDAPNPVTFAGVQPIPKWTVAADPRVLPIGTIVHVAGLGPRRVEDVGSQIRGRELDLFMASCREARQFGRQTRSVAVLHLPPSVVGDPAVPTRGRLATSGEIRPQALGTTAPSPRGGVTPNRDLGVTSGAQAKSAWSAPGRSAAPDAVTYPGWRESSPGPSLSSLPPPEVAGLDTPDLRGVPVAQILALLTLFVWFLAFLDFLLGVERANPEDDGRVTSTWEPNRDQERVEAARARNRP